MTNELSVIDLRKLAEYCGYADIRTIGNDLQGHVEVSSVHLSQISGEAENWIDEWEPHIDANQSLRVLGALKSMGWEVCISTWPDDVDCVEDGFLGWGCLLFKDKVFGENRRWVNTISEDAETPQLAICRVALMAMDQEVPECPE